MILGHLSFEDREILQKLGGQCLLGTNLTQRVLMLDGEAGASKGAFVLILKSIVGSRNCKELRTKQLGERRFEIGRLLGANLLLGADVPANFLSTEGASRVKSLVGGDLLDLEPELKTSNEHFYMHGNFNAIVTSNSRLRVRLEGDQNAWGRRLVMVRYEKPFTGKPIPNIHEILVADEGSGILNFFVEGAQKLFEDIADKGLVLSAEQKRRVHSLLSESDSLRIFLKGNVYQSVGTHSNLTVAEIVAEYHKSCLVQGWAPIPGRIVERQLPDLMLEFFSTQKANDIERGGAAQRGFRNVRFTAD